MRIAIQSTIVATLACTLLACGAGENHRYAECYAREMERIVDSIEKIEQGADPDRAIRTIIKARGRLNEIAAESGASSQPQNTEVAAEFSSRVYASQQRIAAAMMRIAFSKPEAVREISEELASMPPLDGVQ
ncbi:MAG: hypothetical protein RQ741_12440 [Wenzhouxiangellaceae bacterium]|nr:hypothetical protein [Wenzhouxiangellaceae bacterium]